ncbi:MAG: methylglyoxal synthase, partial [Bacteroidota bacterium]
YNWEKLISHELVCTGTTGKMIEASLLAKESADANSPVSVHKLKSGPLGGDQQLGALIAEGNIDLFVFFWDTMNAQPHDVDVKALLRISTLYNVPTAQNRSTADYLISSPLFNSEYQPKSADFSTYLNRDLPG